MNSDIASDSKSTQDADEATTPGLGLPDPTWDESRLLDYMRRHHQLIGGLERTSLQHEYCFGAAAHVKYKQLDGKWTQWAKDQGYPLETFRRRRLLFVRAGSMEALDKYPGKMEAYYALGIYRKPSREELDTLDAEREAKAQADELEAKTSVQGRVGDAQMPGRNGAGTEPEGDGAMAALEGLTAPSGRPDAPTAAEILGQVGSLLLKVEEVGLDDSCVALLDEIATAVTRLRGDLGRKGVAA